MNSKLFAIILLSVFFTMSFATDRTVGDNYKVTEKERTSTGYEYEVKCTDCGKYITIYYKSSTGKYSRGDSPWYTQYRSLDTAAEKSCDSKCD